MEILQIKSNVKGRTLWEDASIYQINQASKPKHNLDLVAFVIIFRTEQSGSAGIKDLNVKVSKGSHFGVT